MDAKLPWDIMAKYSLAFTAGMFLTCAVGSRLMSALYGVPMPLAWGWWGVIILGFTFLVGFIVGYRVRTHPLDFVVRMVICGIIPGVLFVPIWWLLTGMDVEDAGFIAWMCPGLYYISGCGYMNQVLKGERAASNEARQSHADPEV